MLTDAQIVEMAPDAGAADAGRKMARANLWQSLGQSESAYWGECKGSALYQVRIARTDLGYKCSCPSRKFPCKHVLGLFFLASAEQVPAAQPPEWVATWLVQRESKKLAAGKAAVANAPIESVELNPRSPKTTDKRRGRMADGVAQLQNWLDDLIRQGLADVEKKPFSFWETQAARLVDAQAPGLAGRLRRCSTVVRSGQDWPTRLLEELGRLSLLCEAFQNIDRLDPGLQDDIRQQLGVSLKYEEVLARGTFAQDFWQLVGQEVDDDDRVRVQRTYFVGERSGVSGIVLQFAVGKAAFVESMPVGMRFAADVVYWPSATPHRAKILDRKSPPEPIATLPKPHANFNELLERTAQSLSRNPWMEQWPFAIEKVRMTRGSDGAWHLLDTEGTALRLSHRNLWPLLAATGGRETAMCGVWNGKAVDCFGYYANGRFHRMSGAS